MGGTTPGGWIGGLGCVGITLRLEASQAPILRLLPFKSNDTEKRELNTHDADVVKDGVKRGMDRDRSKVDGELDTRLRGVFDVSPAP